MISPKIYLIHDALRTDREQLYRQELDSQGIESWELIPANKSTLYPVQNIARAHKECIRRALRDDLPEVCIMEDDVKFVCPGAYNEFLQVAGRLTEFSAPVLWDILISGSYEYQLDKEMSDSKYPLGSKYLTRFSGLFCYIVNKKAYERILSLEENINFDKQISKSGLSIWMAWPQLALCYDGYSDNTKTESNYNLSYAHNIKLWDCNK